MADKEIPMADSRDMVVAHIIYRRETKALTSLVTGVAAGDQKRAAVVAEHIRLVVDLVHGHHRAEDKLVWPKLHERAAAAIAPIVTTMEEQHAAIDTSLQDVEARVQRWSETADATERDALAAATTQAYEQLTEHLDLEEREVLRLIDAHMTAAEWAEVATATGEPIPADKFAVVFGMGLYEANAEMEEILKAPIPPETWTAFAGPARQAYAEYAEKIFGTPTPARYLTSPRRHSLADVPFRWVM